MKQTAKRILAFVMVVCMAFLGVIVTPFISASAADGVWTLVKDASNLAAGDQVIIAAAASNVALSTTQNNNNRGQATIMKNGDIATFGNDVQVLTLEAGTKSSTFAFNTGSGYLYAASSSSNHLKTKATKDDNGSWKIDITSAGVATIKATGTYTRNWLRYNSAANNGQLFSCYSSGQNDVCIYKLTQTSNLEPIITVTGDAYTQVGETITLSADLIAVEGDVAWASNDEDVATVDQNGVVTGVAMGKTTITATVGETVGEKEITVYPAENSELTIAEAIDVCELAGETGAPCAYSVTGSVKEIVTEYDSTKDNITLIITDGTKDLKVYNMKGGADLSAGANITVTGTLSNYNGDTPQFMAGAEYTAVIDEEKVAKIQEKLNAVDSYLSLAYQYTEVTETVNAVVKVEDELDRALTGVPAKDSYVEWKNISANSGAVYAGQSAGDKDSIQLRSNNSNSGIVTTASGGKAVKVSVVWNGGTTSGRKLDIYGKNTAYTSPTELYNNSTQGDKLGSIVCGTSGELTIKGDYEYIAMRSNSGAMYLTSITITWENETDNGETETKTSYTNVDFRVRCGVDNALADIEGVADYGIQVTINGKSKNYNAETATSWAEDEANGKYFVLIALGDLFANPDRFTAEITVCAYVVVDGITYTSSATKTYSVADMIKEYYEEYNISEVEHLYNYLFGEEA